MDVDTCDSSPRPIVLGDIRNTPVLYFDPDFDDECLKFCTKRDIDALPDVNGYEELWKRGPSGFARTDMPPGRVVDHHVSCFDRDLLSRFGEHDVLFVCRESVLIGAVHSSDYNHPAVAGHLYELVSCYERALRSLANQLALSEEDLITFLEDDPNKKGQIRRYRQWRKKDPSLPEFHVTLLGDLMNLVNATTQLGLDTESATYVRNATMHSKEYVNQKDRQAPDFIYDFATFERLFRAVMDTRRDLLRISNRTALVAGLEGIGEPR